MPTTRVPRLNFCMWCNVEADQLWHEANDAVEG
jgi:hypothetical protein